MYLYDCIKVKNCDCECNCDFSVCLLLSQNPKVMSVFILPLPADWRICRRWVASMTITNELIHDIRKAQNIFIEVRIRPSGGLPSIYLNAVRLIVLTKCQQNSAWSGPADFGSRGHCLSRRHPLRNNVMSPLGHALSALSATESPSRATRDLRIWRILAESGKCFFTTRTRCRISYFVLTSDRCPRCAAGTAQAEHHTVCHFEARHVFTKEIFRFS